MQCHEALDVSVTMISLKQHGAWASIKAVIIAIIIITIVFIKKKLLYREKKEQHLSLKKLEKAL